MLELLPQYQQDAAALAAALSHRRERRRSCRLSAVADITTGAAPLAVNHFGQLPAVTISFSLPPSIALSRCGDDARRRPGEIGLPAGVQGSFQGTAKAFEQSMQGMGFLLLGAILVVYHRARHSL